MAIRLLVKGVITDWCGQQTVASSQNLLHLWTVTHGDVDYNPNGVQGLLGKLKTAFNTGGPDGRDIAAGIEASDFEPTVAL